MADDKLMKGSIQDLPLVDILQVLAGQKKTGTLILSRKGNEGMIVIKEGMIVYAISPGKRMNLTDLLLSYKIITAEQLESALEIQRQSDYKHRLANIFIEHGFCSKEVLNKYISLQIEHAVTDLLNWQNGEFHFEIENVLFDHHVAIDPENLTLDYGFSPQYLIWEATRSIDDTQEPDSEKTMQETEEESTEIPPDSGSTSADASDMLPDLTNERPRTLEEQREYFLESAKTPVTTKRIPALIDMKSVDDCSEDYEMSNVDTNMGLVIVVDDESYFRRVLVDSLQKKGFDVIGCSDVTEALDEFDLAAQNEDMPIIAAIIDVIMPEKEGDGILGGFELLNKLRIIAPDLQSIMVSATHDPELHYKAFELGARTYLDKPSGSSMKYKDRLKNTEMFVQEIAFCLRNIFRERLRFHQIRFAHVLPPQNDKDEGELLYQETNQPTSDEILEALNETGSLKETLQVLIAEAKRYFQMGILYIVRKNDLIGVTGFDNTNAIQMNANLFNKMRIDRKSPIIYNQLIKNGENFTGMLTANHGLAILEDELGVLSKQIHFVAPLVCEGKVIGLFHGSNNTENHKKELVDNFQKIFARIQVIIEATVQSYRKTQNNGIREFYG